MYSNCLANRAGGGKGVSGRAKIVWEGSEQSWRIRMERKGGGAGMKLGGAPSTPHLILWVLLFPLPLLKARLQGEEDSALEENKLP